MPIMSTTHYLPSEELKYSNYPEVYEIAEKLKKFQSMIEPVILSVNDYDEGREDAIYVNIAEVERIRSLSFEITDFLGAAPKVCYDVLMPLREAQESLNELIFSFRYEKVPIVMDRQRTAMKRLNETVNKSGERV